VIFTLSACQPTPTQSIVKEKNLDQMIEDATKTQPDITSAPQGSGLYEKIGAGKTYVKELADTKGKVKIHVNADVFVPDASGVTVQRVEQEKITQAQIDVLLPRLMKGDLFSGSDYRLSKNDTQNAIQTLQNAIAARGGIPTGKTKSMDWDLVTMGLDLDKLQADLETAPDTTVKTPSTGKLGPMDPEMGAGEELNVLSQPQGSGYQSFQVYNYSDGGCRLEFYSEKCAFSKSRSYLTTKDAIYRAAVGRLRSLSIITEPSTAPDVSLTKEDAARMADDLIAALQLQGFKLYSQDKAIDGNINPAADQSTIDNPPRTVWLLRYARTVNDIPATYTVYDCMKVEENNQSAPWPYEDMYIVIDDSGIVGFSWRSPYKVTGNVTENSNVLSFADAMNVFDTMALVVNAWEGYADGNPNLTGIDIKVDYIRFGLTRVTEQNKRNSGLLVPCWDFFGTVTYVMETDGQTRTFDDGPVPVLTINAIDGSIINRSLGY
jgi:hypothetical protein